jgi:hypothetical protein
VSYFAQPERSTRLILDRVGAALGLEITASTGRLSLSGTPALVVDNLVAREPGAAHPLLRADHVALSVPWSTLRSGGNQLTIEHVEIDRPILDVAALQHWLQRRPPGKTRIPVLTNGLDVRDGSVVGIGWTVANLNVQLPRLAPSRRVDAHIAGRYRNDSLQVPFALAVAFSSPAPNASLGVAGDIAIEDKAWRMPAAIVLSGLLRNAGSVHLERAKLSASARYEAGGTRVPFALGVGGRFAFVPNVKLAPVAVALRGSGVIPTLDASGEIDIAERLDELLGGQIAQWPAAWPHLPAPLDARSPLPFRLQYDGATDFSGIADLAAESDRAQFDARFRLAQITSWIDSAGNGSPLPPLDGSFSAPRMELAGAQLQGVELTLDDPDIPDVPRPAKP